MRVTSPLADAMGAVADALRGVYNDGERLALYANANTGVKSGPVLIGEVYDGWEKGRERQGELPTVIVYISDEWTSEILQTVVAFSVFTDEDALVLENCKPKEVARFGDEFAYRMQSTGRLGGARPLVPVTAGTYTRVSEAGEIRVTEDGAERVLEAA